MVDDKRTTESSPAEIGGQANPESGSNKSRQDRLAALGLIVQLLTLVVAIFAVVVALWIGKTVVVVRENVNALGEDVQRVERSLAASQFAVTSPVSGASVVGPQLVVSGHTPYEAQNVYIVITPVETGDSWVQGGPVPVSGGGLWLGKANLGEESLGAGEEFLLRAVATESLLKEGPLVQVPADAIFSNAVRITRKK